MLSFLNLFSFFEILIQQTFPLSSLSPSLSFSLYIFLPSLLPCFLPSFLPPYSLPRPIKKTLIFFKDYSTLILPQNSKSHLVKTSYKDIWFLVLSFGIIVAVILYCDKISSIERAAPKSLSEYTTDELKSEKSIK